MDTEALEEIRQLDALFYALMDDVIASAEFWDERADGFSRRTYVRTAFALVEGATHLLMSSAARFDELRESSVLTSADTEFLTGNKRLSTCDAFKKAVKIHAKARAIAIDLPFSGQGWEWFKKAVALRNEITHPKSLKALELTLDDLKLVEEAMEFFRQVTAPLLQKRI